MAPAFRNGHYVEAFILEDNGHLGTMPTFIDTHCHLNFSQFDADRDDVVQRALDAGVAIIINPAIDLETSHQAIQMAQTYEMVYAQVGIHPNNAHEGTRENLDVLAEIAQHERVVAIGEVGLDYYWDEYPHDVQQRVFRAQLELAAELGIPVVVHSRDAREDTYQILAEWAREVDRSHLPLNERPFKGVWHSFQGDLELAHRVFDLNMCISLGGPVTFKNARDLHELVPRLPLERILLETDAPFLSPHPYRGKRNEPARIPLIAEAIARLQNSTLDAVAQVTTANAITVFGEKLAKHGEVQYH